MSINPKWDDMSHDSPRAREHLFRSGAEMEPLVFINLLPWLKGGAEP